MRGFAYSRLTGYAPLTAVVPATRISSSGGASTPATPFIVIRNRIITRPFWESPARQGGFTIHVHDQPDSYVRIDQIGKLVEEAVEPGVPGSWNAYWLSTLENLGWSEDLRDDHYGTATRFVTYGLTYRT